MKVVLANDDLRLILGHILDLIAPLPGDLDGGLDGLRPAVHGKHLVRVRQLAQIPVEQPELVVTKGPRCQGQLLTLVDHRLGDLGMAVPLIDRGVGCQAVEILVPVHVPYPHTLTAVQNDVERVIVVCAELLLQSDVVF